MKVARIALSASNSAKQTSKPTLYPRLPPPSSQPLHLLRLLVLGLTSVQHISHPRLSELAPSSLPWLSPPSSRKMCSLHLLVSILTSVPQNYGGTLPALAVYTTRLSPSRRLSPYLPLLPLAHQRLSTLGITSPPQSSAAALLPCSMQETMYRPTCSNHRICGRCTNHVQVSALNTASRTEAASSRPFSSLYFSSGTYLTCIQYSVQYAHMRLRQKLLLTFSSRVKLTSNSQCARGPRFLRQSPCSGGCFPSSR